jgi:uncharacterized delta-60 repeat protein
MRPSSARHRHLHFLPLISELEKRTMLDGAIDPSFGLAGRVVTPLLGDQPFRTPFAVQEDGKLLVAGAVMYSNYLRSVGLARYLPSGSPDYTFGASGLVTTVDPNFHPTYASSVAVQRDGKILVTGNTPSAFILSRYTASGVLDPQFGHGGEELIDPHSILPSLSAVNGDIAAVAFQSDGRLIVGGSVYTVSGGNTGPRFYFVARYTTGGQPDPTFGTNGVVVGQATPQTSTIETALSIQPDDKIVVTANAYAVPLLLRFSAAGRLDSAFGPGGKVSLPFPAESLALQDDGSLLVAGLSGGAAAVARYTPSGALDTSFGDGGQVTGAVYIHSSVITAAVAVQPDHKVLLATSGTLPNSNKRDDFILSRYTAAGVLDTAFGTGGVVSADIAGSGVPDSERDDYPTAIAIQSGDRIVVAGTTGFYATPPRFALARFLADGTNNVPPPTGSPRLGPDQDSGLSSNDGLTNVHQHIVFVGVSPNIDGGQIQLLRDGLVVDTESAGVALTDPGPVNDGPHRYTARQVNAFGRTGSPTSPLVITIDATAPTQPATPTLDPSTDTGIQGDNRTKSIQPKLEGTAEPNSTVSIFDASDTNGNHPLGSARVGADGAYTVEFASHLAYGKTAVRILDVDDAGNQSGLSGPLTLTIIPDISPTLIVSVHGQQLDLNALGRTALTAALGLLSPLLTASVLSYDAIAGISPTGSGRALDRWQNEVSTDVRNILVPEMPRDVPIVFNGPAVIKSLEVNWDTYGTEHDPAQEVARRINQIVADTTHDGSPWDILFIGYSRGGPFVHEIMKGLDLAQNPRIDYSEAILLDPTASKVSGDVFPNAMPPGLGREIQYDDGYAFPYTQLSFHAFHKEYDAALLTNDGNTGSRVVGAEYRYVQEQIQSFLAEQGSGASGSDALGAAHSSVPYWYFHGLKLRSIPTQFETDLREFLAAKDHGVQSPSGTVTLLDDPNPGEVISPSSTAPNFKDSGREIAGQVARFVNSIIDDGKRLVGELVAAAKKLAGEVAEQAKKLGDDLVAAAKKEGGEVLAQAKLQQAKISKAAQAEVARIIAGSKKAADALYKEGKLFGRDAAKQVALAGKELTSVQKESQQVVAKAQKDANKTVADVKKKVGAAKQKAEVAAKKAAEKLAAAKAQAALKAQQASAKLAAADAAVRNAVKQEAARLAQKTEQAVAAVSNGYKKLKKKYHF